MTCQVRQHWVLSTVKGTSLFALGVETFPEYPMSELTWRGHLTKLIIINQHARVRGWNKHATSSYNCYCNLNITGSGHWAWINGAGALSLNSTGRRHWTRILRHGGTEPEFHGVEALNPNFTGWGHWTRINWGGGTEPEHNVAGALSPNYTGWGVINS